MPLVELAPSSCIGWPPAMTTTTTMRAGSRTRVQAIEISQIRAVSTRHPDARRDGPDAPTARRVSHSPSCSSTTPTTDCGYAVCDKSLEDIHDLVEPRLMRDPDDQTAVTTKQWTFEYLVGLGMEPIERVAATSSPEQLHDAIRKYEDEGIPMIIDKWEETSAWPKGDSELFSIEWLLEHGEQSK